MGDNEIKVVSRFLPQMRDLAKTIKRLDFAKKVHDLRVDFSDSKQLLELEHIVAILDDRIDLPPTPDSLRYAWKALLRYPFRNQEQLKESELLLTRTLSEAQEYVLLTGQQELHSELQALVTELFTYERKTVSKRQECIDNPEHDRTGFFDEVSSNMPEQPLRLFVTLQSFVNLYEFSLRQQNRTELIITIQETELWRLEQIHNQSLESARNRAYKRIYCESGGLVDSFNKAILRINKYQTARHKRLQLNLF